MDHESVAK